MPFFIQRKQSRFLETIAEYNDSREAHRVARECNASDKTAYHYVSKQPCLAWERTTPIKKDSKVTKDSQHLNTST